MSLSTSAARIHLCRTKYTTKSARIELLETPDGWLLDNVWVTAGENVFEERKKVDLDKMKRIYGNHIYWGA